METHPDLTSDVVFGLGWLYFLLFLMNVGWALRTYKRGQENYVFGKLADLIAGSKGSHIPSAAVWASYSVIFLLMALAHFTGYDNPESFPIRMPGFAKRWIDYWMLPEVYFGASIGLFALVVIFRKQLIKPTVAWVILNISVVFLGLSMTDWDFRQIVGKPDNVPIVSMLFIMAYFTWLYFRRAVDNDERIKEGRPLFEQEKNEKVLVWPDLVYTELICMVVLTAILVLWGIALQAPLEEPANAAATPNPSKAPWYFLGLQELVAHSAFMGGIGIPTVALAGLALIPYLDRETEGTGEWFGGPGGRPLALQAAAVGLGLAIGVEAIAIRYGWLRQWWAGTPQLLITLINPGTVLMVGYMLYSWMLVRRHRSIRAGAVGLFVCFLCGFVVLTVIGTYFRGPNWEFYWSPAQWPGH
jgi:hypothetical protein